MGDSERKDNGKPEKSGEFWRENSDVLQRLTASGTGSCVMVKEVRTGSLQVIITSPVLRSKPDHMGFLKQALLPIM